MNWRPRGSSGISPPSTSTSCSIRPATSAPPPPSSTTPSPPTAGTGENAHMPDVPYRLDGPDDAPPLLLSNSIGTTVELWAEQVPALARHFLVVRYEHRGHGGAPAP